jgi:two-component system, chemotaxis family, chemotaxis protein CheY
MKTLIVEDDFTGRLLMQNMLAPCGECHVVSNGKEALKACRMAMDVGRPYDLICLDNMMPEIDSQTTLKKIRALEKSRGILSNECAKIIMTTVLRDMNHVATTYRRL